MWYSCTAEEKTVVRDGVLRCAERVQRMSNGERSGVSRVACEEQCCLGHVCGAIVYRMQKNVNCRMGQVGLVVWYRERET